MKCAARAIIFYTAFGPFINYVTQKGWEWGGGGLTIVMVCDGGGGGRGVGWRDVTFCIKINCRG